MPVTLDDGRSSEPDVEGASKLAWKYSTNTLATPTPRHARCWCKVHAHRPGTLCVYSIEHVCVVPPSSSAAVIFPPQATLVAGRGTHSVPSKPVVPMTLHICCSA